MSIQDTICDFLTKQLEITGLHHTWVISLQKIILAAALTILVYLVDWISRKIILNAVKVWAERRGNAYASIFVERRVFKHIAHIAPALTVKFGTTVLFNHYEPGIQFVQHATDIYIIFAIVFFFQALIIGTKTILLENPDYRDKPIGSYSQLLNIINYFFGALFTVSEISGQSMWALLTAAGALSAIILLVFKDTITGLVASIQISSNIKITSVSFVTAEQIAKIKTLPISFNGINNIALTPALTNLTIFRTYLLEYLKHHPKISRKKPCSVSLLPTTDKGVPIEIYCFTKEKNWPDHENLLSEITEHIIASVEYFDLEIHESPSAIKTPKP